MAVSDVAICNLALQKLGAKRITSLTEDSPNARSCNACYELIRDAVISKHSWSFAIKRATLAPDATDPEFDYDYAFSMPADCLRVLPPNRNDLDWVMEDRKILTNDGDTLEIRYLYRVTDPTKFHAQFVMSLACELGIHMCEEVTQSNTKEEKLREELRRALVEAKRANAFEQISDEPPEDTWITARL
jgi:hypothetical protein